MGWLPDTFDADAAFRGLASSPTYRVFSDEEGVEAGRLWAAVHLTIHAYLPRVPDAYLEWRWDPNIPEWSWEPMIRGFSRQEVPATHLRSLTYHGKRLFTIRHASRGPQRGTTGRYKHGGDAEHMLRTAIHALRAKGQRVTQERVGEYLAATGTSRRAVMGDVPADPSREVRRICEDFGIDWTALISDG